MRAVMFTNPGPASVLRLVERQIPVAGTGEVRVRVVVSGVNPTDIGARSGRGTTDGTAGPHIPNQDGAGVIDAVGEGVDDLAVGNRVSMWDAAWMRSDGTAQEYVVLSMACRSRASRSTRPARHTRRSNTTGSARCSSTSRPEPSRPEPIDPPERAGGGSPQQDHDVAATAVEAL